jgi:hypothetical protein
VTEAEWMASDEPGAMLRWVTGEPGVIPAGVQYPPSDRKLKLWVEACRGHAERAAPELTWRWGNLDIPLTLGDCLTTWAGESFAPLVPRGLRAHLLRDIVGSPRRPVKLPTGAVCETCHGSGELGTLAGKQTCYTCGTAPAKRGSGLLPSPWLTPTVVSLAHAAYDSRDEATGHLDPVRLAVLADALEEAGCPQEVEGACPACLGSGSVPKPKGSAYQSTALPCPACGGSGVGAHPALAHLRSPGPHVRGWWAIDLITGRE